MTNPLTLSGASALIYGVRCIHCGKPKDGMEVIKRRATSDYEEDRFESILVCVDCDL